MKAVEARRAAAAPPAIGRMLPAEVAAGMQLVGGEWRSVRPPSGAPVPQPLPPPAGLSGPGLVVAPTTAPELASSSGAAGGAGGSRVSFADVQGEIQFVTPEPALPEGSPPSVEVFDANEDDAMGSDEVLPVKVVAEVPQDAAIPYVADLPEPTPLPGVPKGFILPSHTVQSSGGFAEPVTSLVPATRG